MGAKEIDMGLYCPHITRDLLKSNDELYVYGPVIMNSELIVSKKDIYDIKTIAHSKNRAYLVEKAIENYDISFEAIEVNKAVGYFLETGEVDSAIVGISEIKNFANYNIYPVSDYDYISYVLVLREGIEESKEFKEFLSSYNEFFKRYNKDLAKLLGIEQVYDLEILDLGGINGD